MKKNKMLLGFIICFIMINQQAIFTKAEPSVILRHDTFESDLSDWAIFEADSLIRINTNSHGGSWSVYSNAYEYSTGSYRVYLQTDVIAGITGDTQYYASVWIYKNIAVNFMSHLTINWWEGSSPIGDSNSAEYLANTGWFEMTISATSPSNADGYKLIIYIHDNSQDFEINFDDAQFADEVIPEFIVPISFILMTFLAVIPIGIILKKRK